MIRRSKLSVAFAKDPWRITLSGLCVAVGVLQFFGFLQPISTDRIVGLILALFGSLSFVTLNILSGNAGKQNLNDLKTISTEFPSSFSRIIADAKEITILGVSASAFVEAYDEELNKRVKGGKATTFVFVDPEGTAVSEVAKRDQTTLNINVAETIAYQRMRVKAAMVKIARFSGAKGKARVRLVDYPMDFEILLANYGEEKFLYLRHYPYKTSFGGEMRLIFDGGNQELLDYYCRHVSNLVSQSKAAQPAM